MRLGVSLDVSLGVGLGMGLGVLPDVGLSASAPWRRAHQD